jgi:riboflavin-specific deaminase-like protein
VHQLWPCVTEQTGGEQVSEADLERIYAYPDALDRPWVQAHFVSSVDGSVTVSGSSRGLSDPADRRIFALGRDLADVVLVGAGTAVREGYRGIRARGRRVERRARLGLAPLPPLAVVSRRCSVEPQAPLVADVAVPTIVVTCRSAPIERRAALRDAGAEVVLAGEDEVDLRGALAVLGDRGLRRVCCEGGPTLFGSLVADDLVDELCLTVAPLLTGGDAGRIAHGQPPAAPEGMRLASVLREDDTLMLRYRRAR